MVGIGANLFLAAFKAVAGLLAGSIAIVLDAVNNLSDALSSLITIIGARLSLKAPDKEHPMGHGRIEYVSDMVVAAIVLYAGIVAMTESVKKIINPPSPKYSVLSFVILGAAIIVKLVMGTFVKKQGKKYKSNSLVASGQDAFFDAVLSTAVFLCALLYMNSGILLEAYMSIVISVFIIKAGIDIMRDTVDSLLGRRADRVLTLKIKEIVNAIPEVRGCYDLIIYNYGPDKNYASMHVELPDIMTVAEVDVLTRKIQASVYRKTQVVVTGVGVYSYNTTNDEASCIRNAVQEKVLATEGMLQMHGFFIDIESKEMRFDVVVSFDIDIKEGLEALTKDIKKDYPDYKLTISPDVDISD
ncbi:MAG: cation diffusion facilitator family transporter [Lachnospiraceae bacterium]|nr:cation diffusion facilitator family transporter [Lachnospiraceae bacterium]